MNADKQSRVSRATPLIVYQYLFYQNLLCSALYSNPTARSFSSSSLRSTSRSAHSSSSDS